MRSWPPALYRCGCVRTTVAASACIRTSTHACRRAGHSFVVGGDPGSARLPACGGLSAGSARSFAPSLRPVDVQHARLAAGGDARASHVTNSQPQVVTFPPSHFLRPPAARGPLRVLQLCTAPCHVRPVRRQPATCPPRERRMLVRQAQVSRSLRTWQCWPRPPWPPSRAIFCATGVCVHGCSQCCRISWSSSPPSGRRCGLQKHELPIARTTVAIPGWPMPAWAGGKRRKVSASRPAQAVRLARRLVSCRTGVAVCAGGAVHARRALCVQCSGVVVGGWARPAASTTSGILAAAAAAGRGRRGVGNVH